MNQRWEREAGFFLKHPDSPSAEEWEYLSIRGDNGVQTQSIRWRKKIGKRKKIKGNAWTLVLVLNQPFLSSLSTSLSPLLTMCREKRGERFPDIHTSDTERGGNLKKREQAGCSVEAESLVEGEKEGEERGLGLCLGVCL